MIKRLAAIVLAAPFLALPATAPAQAEPFTTYTAKAATYPASCTATSSGTGVKVCWQATGEKLYVKDTAADGRRVGAYFMATYGSHYVDGICVSTLGSGKTGLCDLALTEGLKVTIFSVTCDVSTAAHGCQDDLDWKFYSMVDTHS